MAFKNIEDRRRYERELYKRNYPKVKGRKNLLRRISRTNNQKIKAYESAYRKLHPQIYRENVKRWIKRNPDKRAAQVRRSRARAANSYIKQRIRKGSSCITSAMIPLALVELKKVNLLLKRQLKELS